MGLESWTCTLYVILTMFSGDEDIYVRAGAVPTLIKYNFSSAHMGNENLAITGKDWGRPSPRPVRAITSRSSVPRSSTATTLRSRYPCRTRRAGSSWTSGCILMIASFLTSRVLSKCNARASHRPPCCDWDPWTYRCLTRTCGRCATRWSLGPRAASTHMCCPASGS